MPEAVGRHCPSRRPLACYKPGVNPRLSTLDSTSMKDLLPFSLLSLSAIFFVVDPMAVVPMFIGMARADSTEKKEEMARRASITAFFVLATFAVGGTLIMKALGITLAAFKVAGGLLLMTTSIEMLRAQQTRTRTTP